MKRRHFLRWMGAAGSAASIGAIAAPAVHTGTQARVVVIGGGFGGATAAKYLRRFSDGTIDVTLIEPAATFFSNPLSNQVLGGSRRVADFTIPYGNLVRRHGVRWVRERAVGIDAPARRLRLAGGGELPYDRLIVSPGIGFMWDRIAGLETSPAREAVPHAWQGGAQLDTLRRQLVAMPEGGVFAITIPEAPFRCPPAPYERACQVAWYCRHAKPRAKVIIFDANDEIQAEAAQYRDVWRTHYAQLIEYRPQFNCVEVDAQRRIARFELGEAIRADVLNVLPPMQAGDIAAGSGLATANGRWCEVDFLTFESRAVPNVHVLGDAIQIAPQMPKSGHMANQHGKVCAAAVTALLRGDAVNPVPLYANTCYSVTSGHEAMHVASVHRYDVAQQTMLPVPGTGGASPRPNAAEFPLAEAWARHIWADMLA